MVRKYLLVSVLMAFAGSCAVLLAARRRPLTPITPPTFHREISRILQQRCQECHREGGVAPFALTTFEETRTWASNIRYMTQTRQMPPWKPAPDCGEFSGDLSLNQREIDTIAAWVALGAPEGERRDAPAPISFDSSWPRGTPEMILRSAEVYVPPLDEDMFRCFVLPETFSEERFVKSIDFRPSARELVHHIIAYVDTSGRAEELDAKDPLPGYEAFGGPGFPPAAILGAWFPGSRPQLLPEGVAMRIPPGGRIVLQIHYGGHGQATRADQTEMGLYFFASSPQRLFEYMLVDNQQFTIPAGDPDFRVEATSTLPRNIRILNIGTHAHWLARKMKVQAILPDGTSRCLLSIQDWDPKWQGMYSFKDPIDLPAGTRIELTAHYDNSEANRRNPHRPPIDVVFGEEAENEMCSTYLGYVVGGG